MFTKQNNQWPPVIECNLQGADGIYRLFGDEKYIRVNRPDRFTIHAEIASRLNEYFVPAWNHTPQGLPNEVRFRGGAVYRLRGMNGGGLRYHAAAIDKFVDTLTVIENMNDYAPQ